MPYGGGFFVIHGFLLKTAPIIDGYLGLRKQAISVTSCGADTLTIFHAEQRKEYESLILVNLSAIRIIGLRIFRRTFALK